jgi:hypothetical protein
MQLELPILDERTNGTMIMESLFKTRRQGLALVAWLLLMKMVQL